MNRSFEDLIAEGNAAPIDGWDFSWFEGRATEERPPWSYRAEIAEAASHATRMLDIQTGGGEVTGSIPVAVPTLVATESWPPNIPIARRNLAHLHGTVVEMADEDPFPFADASFDLIISRHPTVVRWDEISRLLQPGGVYLAQHIGAATNHELSAAMIGPFEPADTRGTARAIADAEHQGLVVDDVRDATLRVEFFDIAAVVVFLRKVIWTVPNFSTDTYRDQLRVVDEIIRRDGLFLSHSTRRLMRCHKPATMENNR